MIKWNWNFLRAFYTEKTGLIEKCIPNSYELGLIFFMARHWIMIILDFEIVFYSNIIGCHIQKSCSFLLVIMLKNKLLSDSAKLTCGPSTCFSKSSTYWLISCVIILYRCLLVKYGCITFLDLDHTST